MSGPCFQSGQDCSQDRKCLVPTGPGENLHEEKRPKSKHTPWFGDKCQGLDEFERLVSAFQTLEPFCISVQKKKKEEKESALAPAQPF